MRDTHLGLAGVEIITDADITDEQADALVSRARALMIGHQTQFGRWLKDDYNEVSRPRWEFEDGSRFEVLSIGGENKIVITISGGVEGGIETETATLVIGLESGWCDLRPFTLQPQLLLPRPPGAIYWTAPIRDLQGEQPSWLDYMTISQTTTVRNGSEHEDVTVTPILESETRAYDSGMDSLAYPIAALEGDETVTTDVNLFKRLLLLFQPNMQTGRLRKLVMCQLGQIVPPLDPAGAEWYFDLVLTVSMQHPALITPSNTWGLYCGDDYQYYLMHIGGTSVSFFALDYLTEGKVLQQMMINGVIATADIPLAEAYLFSTARLGALITEIPITGQTVEGQPFSYGWGLKWDGSKGTLTTYETFFDGSIGKIRHHTMRRYELSISFSVDEDGDATGSVSISREEETTATPRIGVDNIWHPVKDPARSLMVSFVPISGPGKNYPEILYDHDAPFFSFYQWDGEEDKLIVFRHNIATGGAAWIDTLDDALATYTCEGELVTAEGKRYNSGTTHGGFYVTSNGEIINDGRFGEGTGLRVYYEVSARPTGYLSVVSNFGSIPMGTCQYGLDGNVRVGFHEEGFYDCYSELVTISYEMFGQNSIIIPFHNHCAHLLTHHQEREQGSIRHQALARQWKFHHNDNILNGIHRNEVLTRLYLVDFQSTPGLVGGSPTSSFSYPDHGTLINRLRQRLRLEYFGQTCTSLVFDKTNDSSPHTGTPIDFGAWADFITPSPFDANGNINETLFKANEGLGDVIVTGDIDEDEPEDRQHATDGELPVDDVIVSQVALSNGVWIGHGGRDY